MPTDYEFIAEALEHFIDRMENIKNDDEVREGGDILIKDIEDNIKKAQSAISAISEVENGTIIQHHSIIVGIALRLWSKDLETSMTVLKEKFHGVNLLLDDSQHTIEKCNELFNTYCK
jgi:hypothetical protein